MKEIETLAVLSDDSVGDGYLRLRRLELVNHYTDGSEGKTYCCEFAERPIGMNAVAVVLHRQANGQNEILMRRGLRPAVGFGLPDRLGEYWQDEIVAGVVEPQDTGLEGLQQRAVEEVWEEAGYKITPSQLRALGPATLPSPGIIPEQIHFFCAEIAKDAKAETPPTDGSGMEEGAQCRWLSLQAALSAVASGDISDLKTEVALRRFADMVNRKQDA